MSSDLGWYETVFWKWWLRSFTFLPLVVIVAILIHPMVLAAAVFGWTGAAVLFSFIFISVEIWRWTSD